MGEMGEGSEHRGLNLGHRSGATFGRRGFFAPPVKPKCIRRDQSGPFLGKMAVTEMTMFDGMDVDAIDVTREVVHDTKQFGAHLAERES